MKNFLRKVMIMEFDDFIESDYVKELSSQFVFDFKSTEGKALRSLLHRAYNEGADHSLITKFKSEGSDQSHKTS